MCCRITAVPLKICVTVSENKAVVKLIMAEDGNNDTTTFRADADPSLWSPGFFLPRMGLTDKKYFSM